MAQGVEDSCLTTGAVTRRRGVSRHTVLRAVRRGEVRPALRMPGGDVRFNPAAVAAGAARLPVWSPRPDEADMLPEPPSGASSRA